MVLPASRRGSSLERTLDEVGPFELFLHDNTTATAGRWSSTASPGSGCSFGGVLTSDVDALVRLRYLCERHQLRAELLFDARKFLGAARMTTT